MSTNHMFHALSPIFTRRSLLNGTFLTHLHVMPPKSKPKSKSKKPGWIDWRSCAARQIIIDDLQKGGPLYQRDNISAEDIYAWYKKFPAFENVVLDQFTERLKDHRAQANKEQFRALQEEQYWIRDRKLYPRQPKNERGELVFDMTPAKMLLREDIKNKLHLTKHKTARKLQKSRPEYQLFKPEKFKDRIHQEIRLQKYHHYLDVKRKNLLDTAEEEGSD